MPFYANFPLKPWVLSHFICLNIWGTNYICRPQYLCMGCIFSISDGDGSDTVKQWKLPVCCHPYDLCWYQVAGVVVEQILALGHHGVPRWHIWCYHCQNSLMGMGLTWWTSNTRLPYYPYSWCKVLREPTTIHPFSTHIHCRIIFSQRSWQSDLCNLKVGILLDVLPMVVLANAPGAPGAQNIANPFLFSAGESLHHHLVDGLMFHLNYTVF